MSLALSKAISLMCCLAKPHADSGIASTMPLLMIHHKAECRDLLGGTGACFGSVDAAPEA
jgi:hypothetical protein